MKWMNVVKWYKLPVIRKISLVHGDDPERFYGEGDGRGGSCLGTHVRKILKLKNFKKKKKS